MTLGQAAGTAAALASARSELVSRIDTDLLRSTLTADGVDLRRAS
jgi:hypothetical protein